MNIWKLTIIWIVSLAAINILIVTYFYGMPIFIKDISFYSVFMGIILGPINHLIYKIRKNIFAKPLLLATLIVILAYNFISQYHIFLSLISEPLGKNHSYLEIFTSGLSKAFIENVFIYLIIFCIFITLGIATGYIRKVNHA